jgi:hypothetical protein
MISGYQGSKGATRRPQGDAKGALSTSESAEDVNRPGAQNPDKEDQRRPIHRLNEVEVSGSRTIQGLAKAVNPCQ